MSSHKDFENRNEVSGVSRIFLEHGHFLKKFLSRFLSREQDIEDVAQEAYLKAYCAEQDKGEIAHPKAFILAQFPNCMHGLLIAAARQARGDALPTMPMRWNHLR